MTMMIKDELAMAIMLVEALLISMITNDDNNIEQLLVGWVSDTMYNDIETYSN